MNVRLMDLLEILGVTKQTIINLTADGVLIKNADKTYTLSTNIQAYLKFKLSTNENRDATVTEANRRKLLAQAELAEIDVAKKRNEIIDRETVINDVTKILTNFKSKLLNLSGRLSADILGLKSRAVGQSILDKHFKELLEELSTLENYADDKFKK